MSSDSIPLPRTLRFCQRWSVCLFACEHYSKSQQQILMKFSGYLANDERKNLSNFGSEPHHHLDSGIFVRMLPSRRSALSGCFSSYEQQLQGDKKKTKTSQTLSHSQGKVHTNVLQHSDLLVALYIHEYKYKVMCGPLSIPNHATQNKKKTAEIVRQKMKEVKMSGNKVPLTLVDLAANMHTLLHVRHNRCVCHSHLHMIAPSFSQTHPSWPLQDRAGREICDD